MKLVKTRDGRMLVVKDAPTQHLLPALRGARAAGYAAQEKIQLVIRLLEGAPVRAPDQGKQAALSAAKRSLRLIESFLNSVPEIAKVDK